MNKLFWWVVDDSTTKCGLIEEEKLSATTTEEAIHEATIKWEKMSTYDQNRCDKFYIAQAPEDDGFPDYDKMINIWMIIPSYQI